MNYPTYELLENTPLQKALIYQIENYSEKFLRFLPRVLQDYPSHGIDHTFNIMKHLNNFVPKWEIDLNQEEILLLYLASYLHDIGCIKSRINHHKFSAEIFLGSQNLCESLGDKYIRCLRYLIISHSSKYRGLNLIPIYDENIRLKLICSIFRLMDACEICYSKCPKDIYDIIEDTLNSISKSYWIGHMNIIDLTFDKPQIQITVNEKEKCRDIINHLRNEVRSIKRPFVEYGIVYPKVKIYS